MGGLKRKAAFHSVRAVIEKALGGVLAQQRCKLDGDVPSTAWALGTAGRGGGRGHAVEFTRLATSQDPGTIAHGVHSLLLCVCGPSLLSAGLAQASDGPAGRISLPLPGGQLHWGPGRGSLSSHRGPFPSRSRLPDVALCLAELPRPRLLRVSA